jgi:hypothetical protein
VRSAASGCCWLLAVEGAEHWLLAYYALRAHPLGLQPRSEANPATTAPAKGATRPAARLEEPGGALLAPVRPLGPVRSWVGLGVVWGVQLGPWAAGFGGRWVTPTGTGAGSSAPPPYRRLPAGG